MTQQFHELKPKVVLGVGAHPDDIDYGAGGSLAVFAKQGAAIYYLVLTDGSKGSADRSLTGQQLTTMRRQEQQDAGELIGAREVTTCDYIDGELQNSLEVKRDIVRTIRKVRPDVVIVFDPSFIYDARSGFINHPDHRAAGQATLDAVFPLARDHMAFPELLAEGLEPHNTKTVLLVNMERQNFAVDITETLATKQAMLAAHASQMPGVGHGTSERAAADGEQFGYKYAEAFMRIDIP